MLLVGGNSEEDLTEFNNYNYDDGQQQQPNIECIIIYIIFVTVGGPSRRCYYEFRTSGTLSNSHKLKTNLIIFRQGNEC